MTGEKTVLERMAAAVVDMVESERPAPDAAAKFLAEHGLEVRQIGEIVELTPTHKHLKTGALYRVIDDDIRLEATNTRAVLYQGADLARWVRDHAEFNDGRFEALGEPEGAPDDDGWGWYASDNEETYTVGPEASRQAVIAAALADDLGAYKLGEKWGVDDPVVGHAFHITEGKQGPLDLAKLFDLDRHLEDVYENVLHEYGDDNGDWEPYKDFTPAIYAQIQDAMRGAMRAVLTAHKIVIRPWAFSDMRNRERVDVALNRNDVKGSQK